VRMGHSPIDCKARIGRWLARKLSKKGAFKFFDQTRTGERYLLAW
jgi:hypothetical protein